MPVSFTIPALLAIAIGGALGALSRYLLVLWSVQRFGDAFPWGTLLVNALGALLAGILIALLQERLLLGNLWRPLLLVGLLGSLTTFSMFALELYQFLERGQIALAIGYPLLSILLCVSLLWCGLLLVRLFV
ncbi:MAG: fluoride efflux transporter CrcB [Gammaproteobacteria bacterium]|nr:fluoride efflux transporter CrcB [Gammaproteobacteria bacterium]MBT8151695.1 fluoride efflux transporter CrcB [Gammaproteobacteria bacterium]NND39869.1 fluoride efflux transporter CrcB [Pseudomonadales bacterium]NNM10573.1 fluoride efflux transporter CrcB [Pseudomonadales bacterium]RZV56762.1 MAG: fluoride efflux transporter CrcB [Pseudomonadales bacterium]